MTNLNSNKPTNRTVAFYIKPLGELCFSAEVDISEQILKTDISVTFPLEDIVLISLNFMMPGS